MTAKDSRLGLSGILLIVQHLKPSSWTRLQSIQQILCQTWTRYLSNRKTLTRHSPSSPAQTAQTVHSRGVLFPASATRQYRQNYPPSLQSHQLSYGHHWPSVSCKVLCYLIKIFNRQTPFKMMQPLRLTSSRTPWDYHLRQVLSQVLRFSNADAQARQHGNGAKRIGRSSVQSATKAFHIMQTWKDTSVQTTPNEHSSLAFRPTVLPA